MMRTLLFALAGVLTASPALAAPPRPFAVSPLTRVELAQVTGMGDPRWRTPFRLTDDLAATNQRDLGSIGATIKDLWLIDVTSPLIAANIRAAR